MVEAMPDALIAYRPISPSGHGRHGRAPRETSSRALRHDREASACESVRKTAIRIFRSAGNATQRPATKGIYQQLVVERDAVVTTLLVRARPFRRGISQIAVLRP